MEGVNDEDSRDSGVSVNSNYGQLDIMCTLVEQQHGNEFNVTANSVTNELDIDLADLKVDETCTNLDVLKWSRNAFVNNKATLNKANTPETPLSSLTNKRIHELSNAVELESSPKSRWANIDNICVASDLNEATYCRTPFIESSNFDIEGPGEAHNSGGDSLDMELCWSDELNVTVTDAISVFSEDSNSNLLQLSGSGMLDFSRKQHGISFRRTQSLCAANCDKVKCEVRHMSNEERKLVGDTPLCTQRTMRKRMSAQLVDVGGSLAPKRSKAEIEIAANQQLQVTEKRAEKERRRSSGIPRILSSGILERGAFAKVRDEQLPKLLEVEYSLQTVRRPQVESGAFRSISAETFIELLTNTDGEQFSRQFVIVDCRYPYEYQGGHVKGAVNIHDPEMVQSFFFPNDDRQFATISHKIPIFYCEFSQKRGPTMAYALRAHDRKVNEMRYPEVFYKEIYLVDYGYRRFYQLSQFMNLCEPNAYVAMTDTCHTDELRSFHFHRSRSMHAVDQTLSKGNRCCRRPVRMNSHLSCKNLRALKEIASSSQDDDSPTQFVGSGPVKIQEEVEDEQDLAPLSKLDFS